MWTVFLSSSKSRPSHRQKHNRVILQLTKIMEAKSKAIEKAYLELFGGDTEEARKRYSEIKHAIDEHGWFEGKLFEVDENLLDCVRHEERPKSLRGIEDNNGWMRIEVDSSNLPIETDTFSIITLNGTKIDRARYNLTDKKFYDMSGGYKPNGARAYPKVTHYRKAEETPYPIY